MTATPTAIASKPLRVLVDGTTIRINPDTNQLELVGTVEGPPGPRGAFGGYSIPYTFLSGSTAARKVSMANGVDGTLYVGSADANGTGVVLPITALVTGDRVKLFHRDEFDDKYAFLRLTSDPVLTGSGYQFSYVNEGQLGTFADNDPVIVCPEYRGPVGPTGPSEPGPTGPRGITGVGTPGPTGPVSDQIYSSITIIGGTTQSSPAESGGLIVGGAGSVLVLRSTVPPDYFVDVMFDSASGGSMSVMTDSGQTFTTPFDTLTSVQSVTGWEAPSARFVFLGAGKWAVINDLGFSADGSPQANFAGSGGSPTPTSITYVPSTDYIEPDLNDGGVRIFSMTQNSTIKPPLHPTSQAKWRVAIEVDSTNRDLTLDAAIVIPSMSAFTSPYTLTASKIYLLQLEYSVTRGAWLMEAFIGGY